MYIFSNCRGPSCQFAHGLQELHMYRARQVRAQYGFFMFLISFFIQSAEATSQKEKKL